MTGATGPSVVLIIDDQAEMRDSLAAFLSSELDDLEVLTAEGASEAYRLIEDREVDIVISDHRMPEETGYEVLQRVRELQPGTGRLLMTGKPDAGLAKRALNEGGIHRYFRKPLDPDEVLEAVLALREAPLERDTESPDRP